MSVFQPQVDNVVAFASKQAVPAAAVEATCLTPRDRIEVSSWHDAARLAGYDRLVIHDRDCGDAQEVGNFLSAYRRGDAWSRWGFARSGTVIRAWCCLSGADVGEFSNLGEALATVLNRMAPDRRGRSKVVPISRQVEGRANVVTYLAPRLKACAQSLGSAA